MYQKIVLLFIFIQVMKAVTLKDKTFTLYIEEQAIEQAITRVANEISAELKNEFPVFICVLNGAFMFASDLMKQFPGDCEINFIRLSSYEGVSSTGSVKSILGLNADIKNRTVVIIEDIVDTGTTLEHLHQLLSELEPKTIKTTTLLFKPGSYKKAIPIDYPGIKVPDDFLVGYGLDYDGLGRNLREIYTIENKN